MNTITIGHNDEHGEILRRSGPRRRGCEWIEYADGYQRPVVHYPKDYADLSQGVCACTCGMNECTGVTVNQWPGTNPFAVSKT